MHASEDGNLPLARRMLELGWGDARDELKGENGRSGEVQVVRRRIGDRFQSREAHLRDVSGVRESRASVGREVLRCGKEAGRERLECGPGWIMWGRAVWYGWLGGWVVGWLGGRGLGDAPCVVIAQGSGGRSCTGSAVAGAD